MLMFYAETSGLLLESDYTKYMRRIVQATFKINIVGFTLLFFCLSAWDFTAFHFVVKDV
jgi:hypothetical protein